MSFTGDDDIGTVFASGDLSRLSVVAWRPAPQIEPAMN